MPAARWMPSCGPMLPRGARRPGPWLGVLLALACAGCAERAVHTSQPVNNGNRFAERLLAAHNGERLRLGLPPLEWNERLAADAGGWAATIARRGQLEHAPLDFDGPGENLFAGTAGAFSLEAMMHAFLSERRNFRPGRFPDVAVSASGDEVGHYTQIIWPETREVGCGLARGNGADFLVCRYHPAGNIEGEPVP